MDLPVMRHTNYTFIIDEGTPYKATLTISLRDLHNITPDVYCNEEFYQLAGICQLHLRIEDIVNESTVYDDALRVDHVGHLYYMLEKIDFVTLGNETPALTHFVIRHLHRALHEIYALSAMKHYYAKYHGLKETLGSDMVFNTLFEKQHRLLTSIYDLIDVSEIG